MRSTVAITASPTPELAQETFQENGFRNAVNDMVEVQKRICSGTGLRVFPLKSAIFLAHSAKNLAEACELLAQGEQVVGMSRLTVAHMNLQESRNERVKLQTEVSNIDGMRGVLTGVYSAEFACKQLDPAMRQIENVLHDILLRPDDSKAERLLSGVRSITSLLNKGLENIANSNPEDALPKNGSVAEGD